MTVEVSRATVVRVIAGVVPSSSKIAGLSAETRFVHQPQGSTWANETNFTARSFWLESDVDGTGEIDRNYTPDIGGNPRVRARVVAVIAYPPSLGDVATFDEVIQQDAIDLAKTLMLPNNVAPMATTHVEYIDRASWSRQVMPDGGARLRLIFDLHHI